MKNCILIIYFVSVSLPAFASEDTPLKLTKDGKLIGLPEMYPNAYFDSLTFSLRINDQQIVIPDCIKNNIKYFKNIHLNFSAFWLGLTPYNLPDYICLQIISEEDAKGFEILFNLQTLEIFQTSKIELLTQNGKISYRFIEQEISQVCRESILNSITKL